jgi:gamma-glutamylcyclotransferase (GGCT)/AIG2-like uncharacterized protein YtfP
MTCDRLLFYGTLMSTGRRGHVLRELAHPVGPAAVRGDLYEVGGGVFPAMLHGEDVTHGELWQVRPGCLAAALRITDGIEGYRPGDPWSMYVREEVPLLGNEGTAWTYFWNSGPRGLTRRVPDGRWQREPYNPEATILSRARR